MTASVAKSQLAVASSISSTGERRSIARASMSNCRKPAERLPPPSATSISSAPPVSPLAPPQLASLAPTAAPFDPLPESRTKSTSRRT
eukprot:5076841-Prymnesium_polylepis.1